jgi:hypothetical protein
MHRSGKHYKELVPRVQGSPLGEDSRLIPAIGTLSKAEIPYSSEYLAC